MREDDDVSGDGDVGDGDAGDGDTSGTGGASGDGDGDSSKTGGTTGDGDATGGTGNETALEECDTPSIDRLQQWLASGEGPTVPTTGSLLESDGMGGHVAKAEFTSASEWHVLVIWLANEFDASVDLSASSGFTLTYSATSDFYIQLRPGFEWSGGAKWHMPIPSTGGQTVTATFPFSADVWQERLGTPPHTFEAALADARGLVPVGNSVNELTFSGLHIHGFEPPCL
jgi:hypothetical protein